MAAENRYKNIIDLPHHVSEKRAQMSVSDRAAQFAPFAALTGYDDIVDENARFVDAKAELSEDEKLIISRKLAFLNANINSRPIAGIEFFVRDKFKDGGCYVRVNGSVNEINEFTRTVVMSDGTRIAIDDIMSIDCRTDE